MLRGATPRAEEMAGTAVLRIVVSSDSMKKATATSHGKRRLEVSEVTLEDGGALCCNLACLLDEPKTPQVMFRIDQYCGRHSQCGDQGSRAQIPRAKAGARIRIDVHDAAHCNGSAQARERDNRVRDAESSPALRGGGDFADQCRSESVDDAADRTCQAHQENLQCPHLDERKTGHRDAADDDAEGAHPPAGNST